MIDFLRKPEVPEDILRKAQLDGAERLFGEAAQVHSSWTDDGSAYVRVRSADGKELVIQYDLKTRRLVSSSEPL